MHHPTDRITHTTAFVTPVMGHSHHEQTLLSQSYISLPGFSTLADVLSVSDYSSSITHCFFSSHNIMCNTNIPVNKNVLSMSLNVLLTILYESLSLLSILGWERQKSLCLFMRITNNTMLPHNASCTKSKSMKQK